VRRAALWMPVLVALLTVGLWALLNRPEDEPPWPSRIQGIAFAPMRAHQDPRVGHYPSIEEIDADLALLARHVQGVRTYEVRDTLAAIPGLAAAHGIDVTIGAWLGPDRAANRAEIKGLVGILRAGHRNLVRVMVGNEVLLRGDLRPAELMDYLDRVRAVTRLPVSTAEPPYIWLRYPRLAEHVDFITVHLLPYWDGVRVDAAVDFALRRFAEIKGAFPRVPVVVGEVGWPSNGRPNGAAEPSTANQGRFLRRFLARAEQAHIVYYVMEAFDQPWKARVEGPVGTYWGVFNTAREPKLAFTQPVVRVPAWRGLAALSVILAVLLLVPLYGDSDGLSPGGKGFLAVTTYAISTAAVWIVYDYTRQYMTPDLVALGVLLLTGGLGVLVLLMAEAHEWAESLWLRRWRRPFPLRRVWDGELPFVSVHVPAHDEPPGLLIETLNALAALDYPHFEVLVVDNNTKDPAVWGPVSEHCANLGGRFRFFHLDPHPGYKAGALNFALRETDERAVVIGVIDADYLVEERWLSDLAPAFADPRVALVQAPQDYRDGDQSAFKALCLAEYRGFFQLGMVTRNERNAIIQHGTMTLIRRSALDAAGGWAHWCITEDAELGLRLLEGGHKALYTPRTYGRGLMPDGFADYRRQRFRWAYGAMRILGAHRRELLGLRRTRLSAGQRYHFVAGWLPWLADGCKLLFDLAALCWSVGMVAVPEGVMPPSVTIALVPLFLFGFTMSKSLLLHRRRVGANFRESLAAGLAGLALSHTIAKAVLAGILTGKIGFYRTPKLVARAPALSQALRDAREEGLFVVAFWLATVLVLAREDVYLLDVRVWAAVLLVQSIPYLASVLVSLASAIPNLPASLARAPGATHRDRVADHRV
jgi:exo-beta-1,3-glucanase (GH17 family)/cellulose synthase/poly-beta-1,6-N-acetylglucosamine synthase-like glycosyltransferase